MSGRGERIFAALMRGYPRAFRERYGPDLLAFFREDRLHPRYGSGPLRPARFWFATVRDLAGTAAGERLPMLADLSGPNRGTPMRFAAALRFDIRNAVRSLRGTPAVTMTALLVLILGIGVSTAIFSVVDGVVLRGLPYPGADRLLAVQSTDLTTGRPLPATYQDFADWAQRQDVFAAFGASAATPVWTTLDAERPERLRPHRLTPELLDVLGMRPAIGAAFTRDTVTRNPRVALISDAVWRRRFGADPSAVGRTIAFSNGTYEIAGVMPRDFVYPVGSTLVSSIDLWVPYVPSPRDLVRGGARNYTMRVVGRLKPGVSEAQAAARMQQLRDALVAEHPKWAPGHGVLVRPLKDSIVTPSVRSWMLMLLGAVGGVLLVACANIANLLLARVGGRGREIGVRAAMGATRWQLVRGLIVESLALTLAGTAGGVVLAYWGVDVLRAALPPSLPRVANVAVDLRVIAAAGIAAIVTGVLCGLLPALQLSRIDVSTALRGARTATAGPGRQRARTVFLVAEVAMTAVLLVGAGVFTSSFVRLIRTEMGFDPRAAMSVSISPKLPADMSNAGAVRDALTRAGAQLTQAVERVRSTPGITSVAVVAGGAPLTGSWSTRKIDTGDGPTKDDEVVVKEVSDGYLETIGARVLGGRTIQATDASGAPAVVVINDAAVRKYFGRREAIGAQVTLESDVPRTVVGVVGGMRLLGPESELQPEAYIPYWQSTNHAIFGSLVIRTSGDPAASVAAVKNAIWSAMPDASIPEPATFEQLYAGLIAQRKLNMILLALFGGLALLIAAIGVYGVFAYLVEQRTKEIGVRMALGAVPGRIVTMVVGRATAAVGVGLAIGFLAAAWLERGIMTFVYSGIPHDPVVYGATAAIVLGLGCLAAYVPARRAARVDPLIAIRAE